MSWSGFDRGGDRGRGRGNSRDRGSSRDRGQGRGRGGSQTRSEDQAPIAKSTAPNPTVRKIEDDSFKQTPQSPLKALSLSDRNTVPYRPGYGTRGKPVTLTANHIEIDMKNETTIFRYDIEVKQRPKDNESPTKVSRSKDDGPKGKKLERIVHLALTQLPDKAAKATDYRSILLVNMDLEFPEKTVPVQYTSGDTDKHNTNSPKYDVKFTFTTHIQLGELLKYLTSTSLSSPVPFQKQDVLQALNILIGHGFKSSQWSTPTFIARKERGSGNKLFPYKGGEESQNLSVLLEAWRGVLLSARCAAGRYLLTIQPKNIAAYKSRQLNDVIADLLKEKNDIARVERIIKRCTIMLTHFEAPRPKIITGFAKPGDGQSEKHPPIVSSHGSTAQNTRFFWVQKDGVPGSYTSVADYFKRQYRLTVSNSLPVINIGTHEKPAYVPAQCCQVAAGQAFTGQLKPEETQEMIKFAVRKPSDNMSTITGLGFKLLKDRSDPTMADFGLRLNKSLVTVDGRLLEGVPVEYAFRKTANSFNGQWNMVDVTFYKGTQMPEWRVLRIMEPNEAARPVDFENCMKRFTHTLKKSGIAIASKPVSTLIIARTANTTAEANSVIKEALIKASSGVTRFVLVVLPARFKSAYDVLKRAGDVQCGIHTVCVQTQKFLKGSGPVMPDPSARDPNVQYFANVALKINLKLGGLNQQLKPPNLGFLAQGKTMVVGLDVTHPSPGSTKTAPSVVGIVASVDKFFGQWPADVRIQTGRVEMVEALETLFESRLRLWQKRNMNNLPDEIVLYRDGVSEGQYQLVREKEMPLIRAACSKVYPATSTKKGLPRLTIIIAGKRHNTRFYPTQANDAGINGNTRNGTIVDRGVTETRIWDFYLQAHAAILGTARPAHYVVVHDECFLYRAQTTPPATGDRRTVGQRAADELENITHSLCYMYGRATKAVSICPPAYYADVVCERARRWLAEVFDDTATVTSGSDGGLPIDNRIVSVHERLRDTMFYI